MRIGFSLDYSGRIARALSSPPRGPSQPLPSHLDLPRVVEDSRALGFQHLEIPMDPLLMMPSLANRKAWEQLDQMRREGVTFSVHLPFRDVRLASLHEEVRRASVDTVRRALRLCAPLRAEAYILHLSSDMEEVLLQPTLPSQARRRAISLLLSAARRSLTDILSSMQPSQLLLENLDVMPPREMFRLAEEFDTGLCLDVGHAALQFRSPASYIRRFAPRLGEVHLHDVARRSLAGRISILQDHQALGAGNLNMRSLFRTLQSINFQGPVVLEVTEEKARQSLVTLRRLGIQPAIPAR